MTDHTRSNGVGVGVCSHCLLWWCMFCLRCLLQNCCRISLPPGTGPYLVVVCGVVCSVCSVCRLCHSPVPLCYDGWRGGGGEEEQQGRAQTLKWDFPH